MITEKELSINNQSYTKKDYATIYPEEVDVVRKLTNRWDPRTSNESDPGVVLLKVGAAVGDKLSYNIDKAILETFMTSCTQETSMRQNCESRAYEMEYFNSAETNITFTYNGEELQDGESITFLAYRTVVKSQDDSICYTILQNVELTKDNLSDNVPAIEGEVSALTVASSNNEYKIQLVNLDDNNRIYFPVSNVAQNGIFISNSKGSWTRVENLNVVQPRRPVYKFGYSSQKGLPYVEFPTDIAAIIDDGLTILYTTTNGVNGNVSVGYLNTLAKYEAYKVSGGNTQEYSPNLEGDTPDIYVRNESAAVNGRNPQTVSEANESYKRTIGVFDTYVTCRDYESAIYKLYDENNYPFVSNVHVADRRDDVNHGVRYISFEDNDVIYKNYKTNVDITPYDLCLYPLSPMRANTPVEYNQSFIPLTNVNNITSYLEDSKCISHDYRDLDSDDIYAIKNLSKLDARIVTTYKVNNYERAQIIQNIQQALRQNFNARNVDYGYEIPYDIILDVIQNADARISSVSLSEPQLTTTYITKDSKIDDEKIYQESPQGLEDFFSVVVARNVLSGKVSLLNFNDDFNYDFGQSSTGNLSNLSKATSSIEIEFSDSSKTYTLDDNEVIQIVGPSLITKTSYTAYVYYWFESQSTNSIPANENYQLKTNEILHIYYVDSNKNSQFLSLEEGTIVESNIVINTINQQNPPSGSVKKGDNYYLVLGAQDHIDIKEFNKVTRNKQTYCYWLRNNKDNALFTLDDETSSGSGEYEIILGDNEYFFYTDANFNTLYTLGSGTTLKTNVAPTQNNNPWIAERIGLDEILEKGLLQLKDKWKRFNFTDDSSLEIQENTIITLTKGNSIELDVDSQFTVDNTLQPLDYDCTYTIDGDTTSLETYGIGDIGWKIRSRLDIVAGKDKSQTLLTNQTITFYDKDYDEDNPDASHKLELVAGDSFNLNLTTDISGGISIDLSSLDANNNATYPLSVYKYVLDNNNEKPNRVNSRYWTLRFEGDEEKSMDVPIVTNNGSALPSIVMMYLPQDGVTFTLSAEDINGDAVSLYSYTDTSSALSTISAKGIYTILMSGDVALLTIESSDTGNIVIDLPRFYDGYNKQLGVETICENLNSRGIVEDPDDVYEIIETYIKNHSDNNFYYSAQLDSASMLESDDLSSPYALYDYNNVANKCTITQIDIDESTIDVVRSSRL